MKLSESTPHIETSADLEEKFFSVADQGMIFEILRSKMYSNSILSICREISCNARDAHREVGKPDEPIHIHLPSALEPYYKIKDFGPGISPDRMENVFIKYTASTKRIDNVQTGGFGLGAKTPFSYTDTFAISTNVNGMQYSYACFIDETKIGKLILTSKAATTEENGTEIIIPVKDKSFTEFATYTEQACRHWKVKPVIKGGEIRWNISEPILEGDRWAIVASKEYYEHNGRIIVDDIEYPLDMSTLRKYADSKIIDSCRGDFVMYFGVGELSLSANREQLALDDKTQSVIRKRLDKIVKEIKQKAHDKIEAIPNFWDANIYYQKEMRQSFSNLDFLGTLSWHGTPLYGNHVKTGCMVYKFTKGGSGYRRRNADPNKLYRTSTQHLTFEDKSVLYVNDLSLKEVSARHVKKALELNPALESIQVLCPSATITVVDLEALIHLSVMNPQQLSGITKASTRASKAASQRLLVFKFDSNCGPVAFRQSSYAAMEEDPNEKILCRLNKDSYNRRQASLSNSNFLDTSEILTLSRKFADVSFYGVDFDAPAKRVEEDFADCQDIEEFVKERVIDNKANSFLEMKWARKYSANSDRMVDYYDKIKPLIQNPQSPMLARLELQLKMKSLLAGDMPLLTIYENVNTPITDADVDNFIQNNPSYDMVSLNEKYDKLYPLIEHINKYYYDDVLVPIADYVNIVDKFEGEKNV